MEAEEKWEVGEADNGISIYTLKSWKDFSDFISSQLLEHPNYVFRGQANSDWKLKPTLDRVIAEQNSPLREKHLENFKFEVRGRRGPNPPLLKNDNDWWALGQHHGLATPLLDWTESPFVALYFAAYYAYHLNSSESLAVFAFSQFAIKKINKVINNNDTIELINNHKPTVKIVKPFSDENNRLVSQRGLFTRGPNNVDIESWVSEFIPIETNKIALAKIIIPNKDIETCLIYLNRMNINHATLFPDLSGASEHCNKMLGIKNY